ncbi:hypothetical protein E2C01_020259 [Portunus trituberculatus]|uniref:Uncharacterized protein n=1 Tax=Portunus trituberculatus TaxID=210409 RepID=A0A5B7DZF6_PORTR|nr:hypothetical protein [Portunus trituberculatus]
MVVFGLGIAALDRCVWVEEARLSPPRLCELRAGLAMPRLFPDISTASCEAIVVYCGLLDGAIVLQRSSRGVTRYYEYCFPSTA